MAAEEIFLETEPLFLIKPTRSNVLRVETLSVFALVFGRFVGPISRINEFACSNESLFKQSIRVVSGYKF